MRDVCAPSVDRTRQGELYSSACSEARIHAGTCGLHPPLPPHEVPVLVERDEAARGKRKGAEQLDRRLAPRAATKLAGHYLLDAVEHDQG